MATPQWKTPPSVSPTIQQGSRKFVSVVKANIDEIRQALIRTSLPSNPYLSAKTVVNVIDKTIVDLTHKAEGGWGDHPNDNGGPTMRGVILITFRGMFDTIFISTGITAVANEAREFKKLGWYSGGKGSSGWETGKQVLYQVCGDSDVASLFIYAFAASSSNRSPASIMSTDPWLGLLMHQAAWASGAGYWKQYKYGDIFTKYGWKSGTNVAAFVKGNSDKSGNIVGELLGQHANWITANTQPGMRLEPFRKGWLNRLVYTPSISWTHAIVGINSEIAKNSLTTDPKEQQYLKTKAAYYNQLVINFPNL